MTADTKEQVREYVWRNRLPSMNALIIELITEYANGKPRPQAPVEKHDVPLRVHVDPEVWEKAMKRAKIEGTPLTVAILSRLQEKLRA